MAGVMIALATGFILLVAGFDLLVVLAIVFVWSVSFWIAQRPPEPAAPRKNEGLQLTSAGMRDLVEHSGLPVLMLDGNRIIVANAAAREAIGSHIVGQDARVALRHPMAVDLLARKKGGNVTVQGLTGPKSTWLLNRQPIDERYCLVELINRTSEADVSRAHTDFVANASHELRTPLSSIIGYMETLSDDPDMPKEQASRFYSTVLREARRLQTLVEDLMSLSQAEAEKHDQPREKVSLVRIAQRAARDSAGLELSERLVFEAPEDEEEDLIVRGNAKQLEQLVRNLVDNAFKYGSSSEKITVTTRRGERDMAVLEVKDRGEGIAAEHIPHLTRRFYRTDPSRSRAAGGTGLGLAIVKHIVERHRGRLDIASRLGEGTCITVRIPLAST